MPELPDVEIYLECLAPRVLGEPLERVRLASPFFLRTFDPPLAAAEGRRVVALRRLGKRLVLGLEEDLFLVLHLMITGRLRWRPAGAKVPGRKGLAAFDFPAGTLLITEMGAKKRASLHLVAGEAALAEHDPGGLEVLEADLDTFRERIRAENRTLKRALTDPRILSGIGNAFSDEILHRAGLSPFLRTGQLGEAETERLYHAVRAVLEHWMAELRRRVGDGFPERVTAFRKGFAVHGRYGEPCPDCGSPVQRVIYAENEANYCVVCQTGGRLLADRVLSRLMKEDWPRSLEEMEARKAGEA